MIAAGNSGASGALTVGSPSTGHGATSVASFDNNYQLAKQFTATGIDGEFSKFVEKGFTPPILSY